MVHSGTACASRNVLPCRSLDAVPTGVFISLSKREDKLPNDAMARRGEEPPTRVAMGESAPYKASVTIPEGRWQGSDESRSKIS